MLVDKKKSEITEAEERWKRSLATWLNVEYMSP